MTTVKKAASAFLANKRIAVTGVARSGEGHGANAVYKRLRERGYQVFAVNPAGTEAEGDPCYRTLADIPGGVDAVVMATAPGETEATMRECAELGIKYAWMHKAAGIDSVSTQAAIYGRERGITVIDGGCPLMFGPASDAGHKLMRFMMTPTGKVPRQV